MVDVLTEVKELLDRPGGFGAIADTVDNVQLAILRAAGAAWEASDVIIGNEVVDTIVVGTAEVTGWLVLIVAILVLAFFRVLEWNLIAMFNNLPWGFGHGPAHVIKVMFSPLDTAENWVLDKTGVLIQEMLANMAHLVKIIVLSQFPFLAHFTRIVNPTDTSALQAEITHLQHIVRNQQQEIDNLKGETGVTYNVTVLDVPLEHRVRRLENMMPTLQHDITVIHDTTVQQASQFPQLELKIDTLTSRLNGVRAVEVGWAELLDEIENQLDNMEHQIASMSNATSANTNGIAALHPLSILLGGGSIGLKTLRSLESRPCQCPTFPGMPHGLGEALALYEFITHG